MFFSAFCRGIKLRHEIADVLCPRDFCPDCDSDKSSDSPGIDDAPFASKKPNISLAV
jgi:hypothetical protein